MINFSKIFLKKKKTLIFITAAGIILLFTPFYEAKATIWDDVVGGLSNIVNALAGIPLYFAVWPLLVAALVGPIIVGIIFSINLWLLRFAAQGNIITLPLTHNGLVDKGVAATTSLVNLAFILVLVIIALATILRRENYGLKKLLPKFIFILLLINFVPVICGAVIDIANVVTRAFLDFDIPKLFGSVFSTPLTQDFNNIRDAIAGQKPWAATLLDELQKTFSFSGIINKIAVGFSAIFFGLFASFIFFLYFINKRPNNR